jgi:hypothetical protein
MVTRLAKIVEAAAQDPEADAARAVVRCVAVLGLLYALRRAEQKPGWRAHKIELVDRDALIAFGARVLPHVQPIEGLVARARAQGDGDAEEVVDVAELVVWWAWAAGLAGPPDANDDDAAEKAICHARAIVARRGVDDSGAARFLERAGETPRAGVSARRWWDALSASARAVDGLGPPLARQCVVGDLAATGPKRRAGIVVGVRGTTVELADLVDGAVLRKFKVSSVQPVGWAAADNQVANKK